ncbi:MAG: biotin/lipoate A/B protein ligase family protein [Thermoplasmata archaeon]
MRWRLLETGHSNAFHNMAMDEAIMEARKEGKVPPTLRLYGWSPKAVSIGYFQRLHDGVYVEKCRDLGIDIVRRITGGGAVFHDMEVTYSVVASETGDSIPQNIQESYELICAGIVEGLKNAGLEASISPTNDVVVGSAKISGNAQTRRKGIILQHGTILLDADYETMLSILKVGGEKTRRGTICMPRERVTSLRELSLDGYDFQKISSQLVKGFEKALGAELARERPTREELERTEELSRTKYASQQWIERR